MNKQINKLQEFLRLKGYTQAEIASRMNVNQSYISDLFTGKKDVTIKCAQKWLQAFGISPKWLLMGEGEMMADNTEIEEIKQASIPRKGAGLSTGDTMQVINRMQDQIDRLLAIIENMQKAQ